MWVVVLRVDDSWLWVRVGNWMEGVVECVGWVFLLVGWVCFSFWL